MSFRRPSASAVSTDSSGVADTPAPISCNQAFGFTTVDPEDPATRARPRFCLLIVLNIETWNT
eukprot:7390114-Prymnesium_polylepis.1